MNRRSYLQLAGLGAVTLTAGCSMLGSDDYEEVATITVAEEPDDDEQPLRSQVVELTAGDTVKLEHQHEGDRDLDSVVTVFRMDTGDIVLSNARNTSESLQPDSLGVPNHIDWLSGNFSVNDQPEWAHRHSVPADGQYKLLWGFDYDLFTGPATVSLARTGGNTESSQNPTVEELITGFRKLIDSGWATNNWLRKDLGEAHAGIDGKDGGDARGLLDIYWREVVASLENPSETVRRDIKRAVTRSRLAEVIVEAEDNLEIGDYEMFEVAAAALIPQFNVSTEDAERIPRILAAQRDALSYTIGAPYSRSGREMTATLWLTGTVDFSEIATMETYDIQVPLELTAQFQRLAPEGYYFGDGGYFTLSQHEQDPTIE